MYAAGTILDGVVAKCYECSKRANEQIVSAYSLNYHNSF